MSYLLEQKRTLSFRRLPNAARRRRARPALALLRAALHLAVAVAPFLALALWLVFSPRLRLQEVVAVGGQRVETAWIEERVASARERNLFLLDIDELHGRLSDHPWIGSLRLRKELPSRLVVEIVEHEPAALLRTPTVSVLLSPRGDRIVEVGPEEAGPGIVIRSDDEAVSASTLGRVIRLGKVLATEGPAWARAPESFRVLTPEDVEVAFAGAGPSLRLRSGEEDLEVVASRLRVLDALLPQLRDRIGDLRVADLRFPRRIVVAPGSGPGPEAEIASISDWERSMKSSPSTARRFGG